MRRFTFEDLELKHDILKMFEEAAFLPDTPITESAPETTNYIIVFTPRSGSTWLGDILTRTYKMGTPHEWFNPDFLPRRLAKVSRCMPAQYVERLRTRFTSRNRVFGMQAAPAQLQLFQRHIDVYDILKNFYVIYLTRRDLAAQAVSSYKVAQTRYFHAPQEKTPEMRKKLRALKYDGVKISRRANYILDQEQWAEDAFAELGIKPLRIEYEDLVQCPDVTVSIIARFVGVRNLGALPPTPYRKIADRKSRAMTAQFRREYPDLCNR